MQDDAAKTSGIEEAAAALLASVYDLAGGSLSRPVPLRGTGPGGAAAAAGLDPDSTLPDVAARYLVNAGDLKAAARGPEAAYVLTVAGVDRVRGRRGLDTGPALRGGTMSERNQRLLVTVISIVLSSVLTRPLTRFIDEQIPERRGIRDDLVEAALKGATRMAGIFIASVLVRRLVSSR